MRRVTSADVLARPRRGRGRRRRAVVTTRHLVRAGLWLVVALGAVAGCYLVLAAELVAWVQVLIYVGAVVVLLLFAVMLTRAPIGASDDLDRPRWPGVLVGGGAGLGLAALLVDAYRWSTVELTGQAGGRGDRRGDLPQLGAAVRGALGAAAGRPGRRDRASSRARHRRAARDDAPRASRTSSPPCCSASASTACSPGATRCWC